MSFCPTCGHYTPDPVPAGIEDKLGRCPVCKKHGIGDDLRVEACSLGYNVHCLTCGLSTGYSHELGDALSDWEAVAVKEARE